MMFTLFESLIHLLAKRLINFFLDIRLISLEHVTYSQFISLVVVLLENCVLSAGLLSRFLCLVLWAKGPADLWHHSVFKFEYFCIEVS